MNSKFRLYSLALVTKAPENGNWDVECYPTEILTTGTGVLKEEEYVKEIKDSTGNDIQVTFTKYNTITATWLSFGDFNRTTCPDVQPGTMVVLFRYSGEDKFYWFPLFSQFDLRRKESVIYSYSNKSKEVSSSEDMREAVYYFQVDTKNKKIKLHTGTNDGESVGYDFLIDTKNGIHSIKDTIGNSIIVDSTNGAYSIKMTGDIKVETETNMELKFSGIKITNGSDELLTLIEDLIDAIVTMNHTGNLGAPTAIMPPSKMKFDQIKNKISKMKA